jgi:flagellar hook-associated protein 1
LNEFSGIVESLPARTSVVTEAVSMAGTINDIVARVYDLRSNINDEVDNYAVEINSLSSRIAELNERISAQEISGNTANDLRDERDLLLDDLSKIVNIFTRERADGRVDVLVGGSVLVDGNRFEAVEAVVNPTLDPERNDLVEIRFTRNGKVLDPNGAGELFGALDMRDNILTSLDNDIDALAAAFIEQINAIHTQGMGLVNYTGTSRASNPVSDPTLALGSANLPFNISTGTFDVNIYDESVSPPTPVGGSPVTININPATTMNDLVAQLSAVPNLSASVDANGYLSVTAAPGFSFANSNDSTNALTALGFNGLFTGFDARTIGVNQDIIDDPALLASRYSTDPSNIGDNTAALAMGELQDFRFLNGGNNTINEFYESIVVQVGIESRSNTDRLNVEQTFIQNFSKRRQEISGVSIDEEVAMLIQFQRAFEASARVVTVTDRMLESLLTMAR